MDIHMAPTKCSEKAMGDCQANLTATANEIFVVPNPQLLSYVFPNFPSTLPEDE